MGKFHQTVPRCGFLGAMALGQGEKEEIEKQLKNPTAGCAHFLPVPFANPSPLLREREQHHVCG